VVFFRTLFILLAQQCSVVRSAKANRPLMIAPVERDCEKMFGISALMHVGLFREHDVLIFFTWFQTSFASSQFFRLLFPLSRLKGASVSP
jgi:hypothetical protein